MGGHAETMLHKGKPALSFPNSLMISLTDLQVSLWPVVPEGV